MKDVRKLWRFEDRFACGLWVVERENYVETSLLVRFVKTRFSGTVLCSIAFSDCWRRVSRFYFVMLTILS